MLSVSRLTRVAVAVSLALTAVFSAVAAIGFSGRSSASGRVLDTSTSAAGGSSSGQRVALPPTGGGSLTAPLGPPVSQSITSPPVTSGGS
jgi:hypothetical protein